MTPRQRSRAIVIAIFVASFTAFAAAQDRPTVFVHGFNSNGERWQDAADRLSTLFQIQPQRPSTDWTRQIAEQAGQIASQVGSLPSSSIAIGHSNGGLVARQWNKSGQALSSIITIGTPHLGVPLVNNAGALLDFNWELMDALWYLENAFVEEQANCDWYAEQHCDVVPFVAGEFSGTPYFGVELTISSIWEVVFSALMELTAPVIAEKRVGSPFMQEINSQGNLSREATEIQARVSLVSIAREFFWGGPIRLVWPDNADSLAQWRDWAKEATRYLAFYMMFEIEYPTEFQQRVIDFLFWVANLLEVMDDWWCRFISYPDLTSQLCWENDTFIPTWSQDWSFSGAEYLELRDGPAHTQQTRPSFNEQKLSEALTNFANVPPRGTPPSGLIVGLQAMSGHFVVAEGGGGGEVRADRTSIGDWERFQLVDLDAGDLLDGDQIGLRVYNNQYLQAVNGGGGDMQAAGESILSWETFRIRNISRPGQPIASNDDIALETWGGFFVVADGGGGDVVRANSMSVGSWEIFRLIVQ